MKLLVKFYSSEVALIIIPIVYTVYLTQYFENPLDDVLYIASLLFLIIGFIFLLVFVFILQQTKAGMSFGDLIDKDCEDRKDFDRIFKKMFTSPRVLFLIIGIIFSFTPSFFTNTTQYKFDIYGKDFYKQYSLKENMTVRYSQGISTIVFERNNLKKAKVIVPPMIFRSDNPTDPLKNDMILLTIPRSNIISDTVKWEIIVPPNVERRVKYYVLWIEKGKEPVFYFSNYVTEDTKPPFPLDLKDISIQQDFVFFHLEKDKKRDIKKIALLISDMRNKRIDSLSFNNNVIKIHKPISRQLKLTFLYYDIFDNYSSLDTTIYLR